MLYVVRHGESAFNENQEAVSLLPQAKQFYRQFNAERGAAAEFFRTGLPSQLLQKYAREYYDVIQQRMKKGEDEDSVPLTQKGKEQARTLGREISLLEPPDIIYCSPHARAQQTLGEMLTTAPHLAAVPHETDPRIREQKLGMKSRYVDRNLYLTLRPFEAQHFARSTPLNHSYLLGESVLQVRDRIEDLMKAINRDRKRQTVLVITHHIAINALMLALGAFTEQEYSEWNRNNTHGHCNLTIIPRDVSGTLRYNDGLYNLPPTKIPRLSVYKTAS